MGEWKYSSLHS